MMTTALEQILERAKVEVATDRNFGLSFATRKKLLLEFGVVLSRNDSPGIGLIRRSRLCNKVVRQVLPFWDVHYEEKHPHRMVTLAEDRLEGKISREIVKKEAYEFHGGLSNSDSPDKQPAFLVGRASVCAADVAVFDELLEPDEGVTLAEIMDPEDPDLWDCAYWAAAAAAGGMPWEVNFDKTKYRAFWDWYLDVAVPEAWSSVSE